MCSVCAYKKAVIKTTCCDSYTSLTSSSVRVAMTFDVCLIACDSPVRHSTDSEKHCISAIRCGAGVLACTAAAILAHETMNSRNGSKSISISTILIKMTVRCMMTCRSKTKTKKMPPRSVVLRHSTFRSLFPTVYHCVRTGAKPQHGFVLPADSQYLRCVMQPCRLHPSIFRVR